MRDSILHTRRVATKGQDSFFQAMSTMNRPPEGMCSPNDADKSIAPSKYGDDGTVNSSGFSSSV